MVNHNTISLRWGLLSMLALFVGCLASCNSSSDDTVETDTSTSVAITSFSISPNIKVMANLDSVFFSIDLNNAVVFNADSLPKGTSVRKLVAVIGYAKTASAATVLFTDSTGTKREIDYKASPSDTIDFTDPVTFRLTAQDGTTTRDYTLKVNVHKMNPDSLMWDNLALTTLPSRLPAPKEQKSVAWGDGVCTLLTEADGSNTVAFSASPLDDDWQKHSVVLPANADIRSLEASTDALYLLADGKLYSSTDALSWSDTGKEWVKIIGGFGAQVLGIRNDGNSLLHTAYPLDGITEQPVDADFPLYETSNFCTFSNKWSDGPIGLLVGGLRADGTAQAATWGFDGTTWADISVNSLPALASPTLIPYYTYRQTTTSWIQKEITTWIIIGGRLADGSLNRDVYVSYDSAVNWTLATYGLQLPDYIPAMTHCDEVVLQTPMSGSLSDAWSKMPAAKTPYGFRKVDYDVNGYDISWQCPTIYLFGGRDADGNLYDTIWKGYLARLTFIPLL